MVRLFVLFANQEMKNICKKIVIFIIAISFVSCVGNPQDSPQSIADTYAQCMCDMDIEGIVSCFEYGEEALSFIEGYEDDFSSGNLQRVIDAARESQLMPEITYEIVEENIKDDKGTIRIRFDMEFDDGEEVHKSSDFETVSVYCHEGQWWVGKGYSKKDREMGRRMMNFFNKLR